MIYAAPRRLSTVVILLGALFAASAAPAGLAFKLALSKESGGTGTSVPFNRPVDAKDGEAFRIHFTPESDSWLYLVYEDPAGRAQLLFQGHIRAGAVYAYPEDDSWIHLEPPSGSERFHLVVSRDRLRELEAKLARLPTGSGKASDAVAEALATMKTAGGPAGESPGKPVPMGGVARGGPDYTAYSFSGASTYVKTIRIIH
jgi:hypothetical protein